MIDVQEEFRRLVSVGVARRIAATLVYEQLASRHRQAGALGGRPRTAREHGSERGFRQHRTDLTPACGPCLSAHTAHNRGQVAA